MLIMKVRFTILDRQRYWHCVHSRLYNYFQTAEYNVDICVTVLLRMTH
jgi:hypothetical protein